MPGDMQYSDHQQKSVDHRQIRAQSSCRVNKQLTIQVKRAENGFTVMQIIDAKVAAILANASAPTAAAPTLPTVTIGAASSSALPGAPVAH